MTNTRFTCTGQLRNMSRHGFWTMISIQSSLSMLTLSRMRPCHQLCEATTRPRILLGHPFNNLRGFLCYRGPTYGARAVLAARRGWTLLSQSLSVVVAMKAAIPLLFPVLTMLVVLLPQLVSLARRPSGKNKCIAILHV